MNDSSPLPSSLHASRSLLSRTASTGLATLGNASPSLCLQLTFALQSLERASFFLFSFLLLAVLF